MKTKYLIICILFIIVLISFVNAVDNDTYEVISSDNNTNDTLSVDKNISKLKNNNSEESVILTPIIKINPNILRGHAKDKVKVSVNVNAKFNDVKHKVKVGKLSLIKNGKTIKTIDLSKNNQPIKFMITLKKGDKYQLEYEGASDHSGEIEFTYKDAQEKIPIKIKDKKINKDSKKESKKKVKKTKKNNSTARTKENNHIPTVGFPITILVVAIIGIPFVLRKK